jgi:tRNA A37 threonylcarbamoyladenosine dehydratase
MNDFYKSMTHRTLMVIGDNALERLSKTRVIIFGVGGVGSWCAESLIRSGLADLTMVDSDIICATNLNRQIQTTSKNIGAIKVEELGKRLLEINPSANIVSLHTAYEERTCRQFDLGSYDYVIDAIDSLQNKVLLIEQSQASAATFFSSMGAAAKTDPAKIKIDLFSRTRNCPLARNVRQRLRKKNVSKDFLCVYSEEIPLDPASETVCGPSDCPSGLDRENFRAEHDEAPAGWRGTKKRVNGSLVHITGIFGFMLSGLIINDIISSMQDSMA